MGVKYQDSIVLLLMMFSSETVEFWNCSVLDFRFWGPIEFQNSKSFRFPKIEFQNSIGSRTPRNRAVLNAVGRGRIRPQKPGEWGFSDPKNFTGPPDFGRILLFGWILLHWQDIPNRQFQRNTFLCHNFSRDTTVEEQKAAASSCMIIFCQPSVPPMATCFPLQSLLFILVGTHPPQQSLNKLHHQLRRQQCQLHHLQPRQLWRT